MSGAQAHGSSTLWSVIYHLDSGQHSGNPHSGSLRFSPDMTLAASTHFVPLPILVPIGFTGHLDTPNFEDLETLTSKIWNSNFTIEFEEKTK